MTADRAHDGPDDTAYDLVIAIASGTTTHQGSGNPTRTIAQAESGMTVRLASPRRESDPLAKLDG